MYNDMKKIKQCKPTLMHSVKEKENTIVEWNHTEDSIPVPTA